MQITSLTASLVAPLQLRPRERAQVSPPWRREVPPDSVDVRLMPRVNRYGRPALRFRQLAAESQQYAQRLSLYRDVLDVPPPGTPSPDELREALGAIEGERERELERELERERAGLGLP